MKHIGNILFSKDSNNDGLFNICDEKTMRQGIPSLIVGWSNVKKLYPNQNIIDWKIDDNTYWTFGKREKRDRYETSIVAFKKLSLKKTMTKLKYRFVDILSCDLCEKELLNETLVDKNQAKTIYIYNDIVYLHINGSNDIIGFNLKDIDYLGKDRNAVLKLILDNGSITLVINVPYSIRNEFINSLYVIPYIYSE